MTDPLLPFDYRRRATAGVQRTTATRIALPTLLIVSAVWLMVGCVYIPTWERVQLRGTKRDFRDLTATAAQRDRPIAIGRITRVQVEALLGPPPYASVDGLATAYMLTTRHGLRVVPLCMAVGSGSESQVALRLDFKPDGTLNAYRLATASHDLDEPISFISDGINLSREYEDEPAINMVDHGDLRPTAAAPPPPFPEHDRRRFDPSTRTSPPVTGP